jgi:hypothetical protein
MASLMGEPARGAILVALLGGWALPAGDLAFVSNVAPQTARFHLGKLRMLPSSSWKEEANIATIGLRMNESLQRSNP